MLQRYLGNKQSILPGIVSAIAECADDASLVCDVFSGTLAVTLALKRAGYRVASNDINYFSHVYGQAYLLPSSVPDIDAEELIGKKWYTKYRTISVTIANALRESHGYHFLKRPKDFNRYVNLLTVLRFLEEGNSTGIPEREKDTYIYDTYSPVGRNAAFTSLRGTKGKRAFFSPTNAKRIDNALSVLRHWWRSDRIGVQAHATLLAILMDGIEKVSNTQGTYHDFPRGTPDKRSLQPLVLTPPPYDDVLVPAKRHILGCEEDSTEFVRRLPAGCVLYMDPPYNFRQYSTYYFMPNLICKYHLIDDLAEYFHQVEYVRGQNMRDNYDSPFCKRESFIPALEKLIVASRASAVVLSYFNGRNHWNDHANATGSEGFNALAKFFRSSLFTRGSFRHTPVERMNYQSYGGHKAQLVDELILMANIR